MIEVVLDNEIKYINTELTISQYQKLIKQNNKTQNKTELLAMFLDVEPEEVRNLPKNQVDFVLTYVAQLLEQNISKELVLMFEHDGVKYGLENDWSKLAWGAWEDFEILSAENIEQNIAHIMAILYRPVIHHKDKEYKIEKYDSEKVTDRIKIMGEVPVKFWFGSANFFFQIAELYITDINNSLTLRNKWNRMKIQGWKILPKFLQKRLPLDSILDSHSPSLMRILPKYNR